MHSCRLVPCRRIFKSIDGWYVCIRKHSKSSFKISIYHRHEALWPENKSVC
jgi:hypothetical protein